MYNQSAVYRQMQSFKRDAVNQFWADYIQYSAKGLFAGAVVAVLLTRPALLVASPIKSVASSPLLPLYAGIAGGIALSHCADRFNQLQRLEHKIVHSQNQANEGSKQLSNRLESLHLSILASRTAFITGAPAATYPEMVQDMFTETWQSLAGGEVATNSQPKAN